MPRTPCPSGTRCIEAGRRLRHHPLRHPGRWTWRASRPGSSCSTWTTPRRTHAWIAGQKSSPFEMGLGWTVALDKPGYFVGRRALEREARDGPAWKIVGLEVDWDGPRAGLRRGRPATADPGHGGASQPAGAQGRPAGRLRHDQHLVAAAQEVHRAGAPRAAALRARHARSRWRSRSSTTAATRRPRVVALPVLRPGAEAQAERRHATTRS